MRVGIDRAREHVAPGRVDHAVRVDVQRLSDQGDPLALDEDVGDVVVRRGDDAATLDQDAHDAPFAAIVGTPTLNTGKPGVARLS
jgi:hypothetical protein